MRRRFGLVTAAAVAVAGAVAIVSIGLTVAGSSHSAPTARATIGLAGPSGAASGASITHSQAMPRVQVAHGVLTPAVRDMPRLSGHWNKAFNKVAEHSRSDSVRMPDKHEGSALVQHGAPRNAMPSPIVNFEGVGNVSGASPPDTEGDIGPNHYMQWVNLAFRIYNRNGTPASNITPGYQLFTGQSVCGSPSGNGGDPIVLYDQFANRWIACSAGVSDLSERAVLPVRRVLLDERPDGHVVRIPVRRARDQPQRLSEVRRLADPALLHDHRQPVPRAGRRLGRGRRLRARARRADERLRQRADALQGHAPGRSEPLGRHASGRPRRFDAAA